MVRLVVEARPRHVLPAALSAAVAALLLAPGVAFAGTLDQQQTDAGSAAPDVSSLSSRAQTFTAGLSGKIDRVDLDIATTGSTTTLPLAVEIRSVSGSLPSSTVLTGASVPASSVSDTAGFVPISFAAPATISAGTQYAIVAYTAGAPGNDYAWTQSTATNPYTGGDAFVAFSSPPTTTWMPGDPEDFAFKTYVAPDTPVSVPPGSTSTTGQRAAALKKCKKKRSHKARKKCKKKAKLLPV